MNLLRERGILDAKVSRVKKDKTGTSFNELFALYNFDREIKNIFLKYILEIENNFKSESSHDFSKKYGHDNYLKIDNLHTVLHPYERNKTATQKIREVQSLIANMKIYISQQSAKFSY